MSRIPSVTGWRYWNASQDLDRTTGAVRYTLNAPLLGYATTTDDVWTDAGPRDAQCRTHAHAAPSKGCECGYRVMSGLAHLCRYLSKVSRALDFYESLGAAGEGAGTRPVALVRVRGTGRALEGTGEGREHDADTLRVARLRIVGPILLSPNCYSSSRAPELSGWGPGFREAFGVPVVTSDPSLSFTDWLARAADHGRNPA